MGYFHDAAKLLVPSITEIEGIAGSKKAFSLKIDGKEFRLNRINTVTRLSFIRRLGAMLEELDIGLLNSMGKAAAFKSKGMDAESYNEAFNAAPKLVSALCNEKFENLIVESARNVFIKKTAPTVEFVSLTDESELEEAIDEDISKLLALGFCYLEVNTQDFLKQLAGTIQSRLSQTDVLESISLPKATE